MILEKQDTFYVAHKVMNYFKDFNRIDDYFRSRKIERVKNMPAGLPGMSIEDDLFQDFDMHPEDMDFEVVEVPGEVFNTLIEKTASFSPDENPGKTLKVVVKEKTTNTIVGFIRYGSPLINSKPRNDFLGGMPDLDIFNHRAIMGFNIVPAQPFGFNCLGGKLLAAICCSHDTRRILNKKYNNEFCLFETTSLYGNLKTANGGASMYDGMRPYLRFTGFTESKFLLTLGEEIYPDLKDWFTERNGGEELIPVKTDKGIPTASRKLKIQTKFISIIKNSLKKHDTKAYDLFVTAMASATDVTTKKRFFMSTYGYSNAKDVLLGKTDTLIKGDQYDKFEMENIINWWKKKAVKRYNNIVADGRIRKELEVWNQDTMNKIDIIR
jgi:hypothetical protein|tara:strand:+ start:372 stop:1514 length:1143 start_codon:yes stop_codon:yes gene_type:complete